MTLFGGNQDQKVQDGACRPTLTFPWSPLNFSPSFPCLQSDISPSDSPQYKQHCQKERIFSISQLGACQHFEDNVNYLFIFPIKLSFFLNIICLICTKVLLWLLSLLPFSVILSLAPSQFLLSRFFPSAFSKVPLYPRVMHVLLKQ